MFEPDRRACLEYPNRFRDLRCRRSVSPAAGVPTAHRPLVERDHKGLKRKSGGTQEHAASVRIRHGADGCGRTGRQWCGNAILPPGWEGSDLEHVRPVFRQGSPFAIRDQASRGKRIAGGHKPPNGALKGAIYKLPNEAACSAPSEIPWPQMVMGTENRSSHGQVLPRERRSVSMRQGWDF